MRMEKFEYEFVKETGVRVIIGKGGMKENTERACKEFGPLIVSIDANGDNLLKSPGGGLTMKACIRNFARQV